MLRLGCRSVFTGLESIAWLLEPGLNKNLKKPPRLVQAGLGVEAELVGVFSVLCRGADACSQRLGRVLSKDTEPCPARSSSGKNFTGCNSFAALCCTCPCSLIPVFHLVAVFLAPSPVSVAQGRSASAKAVLFTLPAAAGPHGVGSPHRRCFAVVACRSRVGRP